MLVLVSSVVWIHVSEDPVQVDGHLGQMDDDIHLFLHLVPEQLQVYHWNAAAVVLPVCDDCRVHLVRGVGYLWMLAHLAVFLHAHCAIQ